MDRRESLFHEFGRDGASKQQLELIAKTIASSPKLNHELTRAIDAGDIGRLGYVARNSSADGTYDSTHRALNLSPRVLDQPETRRTLDRLASVMGHEVSHAMQRADAFSLTSVSLGRSRSWPKVISQGATTPQLSRTISKATAGKKPWPN